MFTPLKRRSRKFGSVIVHAFVQCINMQQLSKTSFCVNAKVTGNMVPCPSCTNKISLRERKQLLEKGYINFRVGGHFHRPQESIQVLWLFLQFKHTPTLSPSLCWAICPFLYSIKRHTGWSWGFFRGALVSRMCRFMFSPQGGQEYSIASHGTWAIQDLTLSFITTWQAVW